MYTDAMNFASGPRGCVRVFGRTSGSERFRPRRLICVRRTVATHACRTFATAALVLVVGCVTAHRDRELGGYPVLVHILYTSGGDSPITETITVFQDGLVRIGASGSAARRFRLTQAESHAVAALVGSPAFSQALAEVRQKGRSCCDQPEIVVSTSPAPPSLNENGPDSAWVDLSNPAVVPQSLNALVAQLNRIAQIRLGNRYVLIR